MGGSVYVLGSLGYFLNSFTENNCIKIMAENTFIFFSSNPHGLRGDLKSKTFTLEQ